MSKFDALPEDPDKPPLYRGTTQLDGIEAAVEIWNWDGWIGNSVIFWTEDVKSMDHEELKSMIRRRFEFPAEQEFNVVISEDGYTFVNFVLKDMLTLD